MNKKKGDRNMDERDLVEHCEEQRKLEESMRWDSLPLMINKSLAGVYDSDTNLFLSVLIDKHKYLETTGNLPTDGFFCETEKSVEEKLNITLITQETCIKILKRDGYLETRRAGVPPKRHFKLFFQNFDFDYSIQDQIIKEITKEDGL